MINTRHLIVHYKNGGEKRKLLLSKISLQVAGTQLDRVGGADKVPSARSWHPCRDAYGFSGPL